VVNKPRSFNIKGFKKLIITDITNCSLLKVILSSNWS